MRNRWVLFLVVAAVAFVGAASWVWAQKDDTHIHVVVNMVQLNVAVTDNNGNYITGLRPQDFAISEDGIQQKMATFAEGVRANAGPRPWQISCMMVASR